MLNCKGLIRREYCYMNTLNVQYFMLLNFTSNSPQGIILVSGKYIKHCIPSHSTHKFNYCVTSFISPLFMNTLYDK